MDDLIEQLVVDLKKKKYSKSSLENHRRDLKRFQQWLQAKHQDRSILLSDLNQLSHTDLQDYRNELLHTLKERTVARHISSLKLFFRDLEVQGLVPKNPMNLVSFPKIPVSPPESLTPQEVTALLDSPSSEHYLGLRDKAMLELAYSSGLKIKELLNLDVEDLFLDLGFIKIRGKRERMVPMTQKAIQIVEQYLKESRRSRLLNKEDSCMFPNRNGTRMTRIGFWNMMKKHAKRAGIQSKINPRIVRHSFAIHLIQNGIDLPSIQKLFGYKELDATLQYAHVNRPDYFEVYQKYHPRAQAQSTISTYNEDQ